MGSTCFQARLDLADLTRFSDILNSKAISFRDFVDCFIAKTISSVKRAFGWVEPMCRGGLLSGFTTVTRLSFAAISCIFSNIVPKVKCAGLQQAGLSQECIITKPAGILPLVSSYTQRCASFLGALPPALIMPYPLLFLFASHNQHSFSERFSILAHSLFSKVSCFPAMTSLWVINTPKSTEMLKGGCENR